MATATVHQPALKHLNQLLEEIAAEKRAAENSEAGQLGTDTQHPSKSVPDNTQPTSTGAHAQELTSYIQDNVATGGIDSAKDNEGGKNNQLNMGLTQSSVGEDPKTEDDYKDKIKDPGTSTPVTTDDGQKYAGHNPYLGQPFGKLAQDWGKEANALLAELLVAPPAATATKPDETTLQKAAQAGYAAAAAATPADSQALLKRAATELALNCLQEAEETALDTYQILRSYGVLGKRAGEDEGGEKKEPDKEKKEEKSESGEKKSEGGPPPEMPAGDPGMGAPPGAGGPPSGDDTQAAIEQLIQAMLEMGITPEQFIAELQNSMGGGGGGMPPPEAAGMPTGAPPGAGGGMPPGAPPGMDVMAEERRKIAEWLVPLVKQAGAYQRTGKYQFRAPRTPQERAQLDQVKQGLLNILNPRR